MPSIMRIPIMNTAQGRRYDKFYNQEDFGDDMDGFGGIGDDPISLLLTDPRFKQMRDDIRTNPDKAKEYLETLKDSSPELYEILKRDQEALDEMVDAIHEGSDLGDPVQLDFDGMDDAQTQELLQGLAQGRLPIGLINQLRGNRAGIRVGGDGAEGGELPNIGEALS